LRLRSCSKALELTIIPGANPVPYDRPKDFIPIGTLWWAAPTLGVCARPRAKTVAEFAAYEKPNPSKATVAGAETMSHLALELLLPGIGAEGWPPPPDAAPVVARLQSVLATAQRKPSYVQGLPKID
jgi:hypothetical protein